MMRGSGLTLEHLRPTPQAAWRHLAQRRIPRPPAGDFSSGGERGINVEFACALLGLR